MKKDNIENITILVNHFKMEFEEDSIYSICLKCNTIVEKIDLEKENIEELEKIVGKRSFSIHKNDLTKCRTCKKIFWKGNAYKKGIEFAKKYTFKKKEEVKEQPKEEDSTTKKEKEIDDETIKKQ